jgi:hypothetical protein
MSLPVATTVSGMDSLAVLRKNLKIARNFVPMTKAEKTAFRKKCAATAADGRYELYKVSIYFDGAEGRKQHHFPSDEKVAA